jgi:hypothetical protein
VLRGILFTALLTSVCWWLFAEGPIFAFCRNQQFTLVLSEESFDTVYPFGSRWSSVGCVRSARNGWGSANGQIERFAKQRGITVLARTAARADAFSFVAPLRWTALTLAPEGVYTSFGRQEPMFSLYPIAAENPFITRSRSIPDVQIFLSEARFPASCYQMEGFQHVVEFYHPASEPIVVRVALNDEFEPLVGRRIPLNDYTSEGRVPRRLSVINENDPKSCFPSVIN